MIKGPIRKWAFATIEPYPYGSASKLWISIIFGKSEYSQVGI